MKYRIREVYNNNQTYFSPEYSNNGINWLSITISPNTNSTVVRSEAEKAIDRFVTQSKSNKGSGEIIHEYSPHKNKQQLLD